MRKHTLVCKASKKGVLVLGKKRNYFYPKTLKGKQPHPRLTRDEQFIKHCISGVKKLTADELRGMSPEQIQEIDKLHKKAMTIIVRMKAEVALAWSKGALKPFCNRSGINELVIDDIEEQFLEIDIPRPILIARLLELRETQQPAYVH